MEDHVRAIRRRLGLDDQRDAGFSLLELMIALGIFTIFIAMFLAAVVSLSRGTVRARLTTETASGISIVFQNIDRQVRYADSINFPGTGPSGARYIEFRTPASSTKENVTRCTQWRYVPNTGRLESRQWSDVAGAVRPAWSTKLSNVISVSGAKYPFEMVPATQAGTSKQQLVLTIEAGNPSAADKSGSSVTTRFVARNSSITSMSNNDSILPGASNTPVCTVPGDRP
jgi:prepilin-type N-terminal cleavage/methylation domain-containing protein